MIKSSHRIAIVGPGAIGCLFGALLREAGHQVIMLDNQADRASKIDRDGIHIKGISGSRVVRVTASSSPKDIADCELVILATKSYDTEVAVNTIAKTILPSTPVLTLQNGLGNVEIIRRVVGEKRTIGGITSHGATLVSPGSIIHAGAGKTIIGTPSNLETEHVRLVKEILRSASFNPQISEDLEATIWGKLIINVGINALTAITRLNNGRLLEFESARAAMKDVVAEAFSVATAKRIHLPYEDPLGQVEEVCRLTAKNVSSMLQDILARRRTEIDAINGAVARLGGELGVPTPVNSTLASLVRTIEASYDLQVGGQ